MIPIKLYKFNKLGNSTKQPDNTVTQKECQCLVKTASSILSPSVLLKDSPVGYNYAYIAAFNRYYFITDISYNIGEWEVSLTVDALATYKSELGNISAYVVRAASDKTGTIKDTAYPITGAYSSDYQVWNPIMPYTQWYYVTVIGSSGSSYTYAMNLTQFTTFANNLLAFSSDSGWLSDVANAIKNSQYNPLAYVTNCFIAGVAPDTSLAFSSIDVGTTTIAVNCFRQNPARKTLSHTFTVASHPQAGSKGIYCNMSPYSEHILCMGSFGNINVPADLFTKSTNTIDVDISIDLAVNMAVLNAKANGTIFANVTSSVGSNIAIAANSKNLVGGAISLATALAGTATAIMTKDNTMALKSAAAALGGIAEMGKYNTSTTGGIGSDAAMLTGNLGLYSLYHTIADHDSSHMGWPLCKYVVLNTLSGYILCEKGTFYADEATDTEIGEINAYMTSGFYYE